MTRSLVLIASLLSPVPLAAGSIDWTDIDIAILGELHDNDAHHARQAALIGDIAPTAVVFEMLLPEEAHRLGAVPRDTDAVLTAFETLHWPNIADYADVLRASPRIIGAALPRDQVRAAFMQSAAAQFTGDAALFGLNQALPDAQLEARKTLQYEAHCQAMPLEMMGGMVEAQRLRDAAFAQATLEALDRYGAPVVLITGNGHARLDWGVPSYVAKARPDVSVLSLGQGETGTALTAPFDIVEFSPPAERDDPCAVFQ